MNLQNFQKKDREVIQKFLEWRKSNPNPEHRLNLSWSNWGFGIEPLEVSAARLAKYNIHYIELHGNRYGPDLGYKTKETKKILDDHGINVAGLCGMVSPESELSSNKPHITQRSIDYFRRNIEMCAELGGSYILFTPGATALGIRSIATYLVASRAPHVLFAASALARACRPDTAYYNLTRSGL